ncbi:MAG TPA: radical SAM family heme chaperone HemW [Armatimonadota bacterium]|nr:radical SAM family heme chaperone HemW [Armatimonadota bacterium]
MPALYVHIPFCLSKCYYCDFVSAVHESKLAGRYVDALCRESALRAEELERSPGAKSGALEAPTVFFGGGTPTTLEVDQLGRILAALRRDFRLQSDAEITIEANPRTHVFASTGSLAKLREHGANRLSIGAQSFDDNLLRVIGRDHGASEVEAAVSRARTEGFDNLSIDLIFALPGQSLGQWERTLERALALNTEHISLYNLTIEEGTVFGERYRRGEMEPAPSDLEADMFALAITRLTAAGYDHYEVSNFARPGCRSRHNQIYWRREDYLGLGVGAHSCIGYTRFANGRNTLNYVKAIEQGRSAEETREDIAIDEAIGEALWLGLRQTDGVNLTSLSTRFGIDPSRRYQREIQRLLERGLLRRAGESLSLTRQGLFLGNEVFCQFA